MDVMNTQPIGSSPLVSTRLSYGCMRIAGTWNPSEVTAEKEAAGMAAVIAAYEAGYTLFDHADIYCRGACESIFGKALRQVSGMRERVLIATKCGIRFGGDPTPDAPHRYDFSAEHILRSCDGSLRRLGIDTIDIYQLHRPDLLMNPQEVAGAFDKLHRAGKVRYFGVSNFLPSFVTTLQKECPFPLVVNQVEISLARLDCFYDGTLDQCLRDRITPLAWSPVGGGFLATGGKVRDNHPHREEMLKLQNLLDEVAARYDATRTAIALAWLLKHPSRIIPIVGSANPQHIRDATQADRVDLSREDWYRLLVAARMKPLP
jgi:predicted oxidoreductase